MVDDINLSGGLTCEEILTDQQLVDHARIICEVYHGEGAREHRCQGGEGRTG